MPKIIKFKNEVSNAFLIFIGIAIYFLIIEFLGLSDIYYLRLLNMVFVLLGVGRTLKSNIHKGKRNYLKNFISGMLTSAMAVLMSVIAFRIYIVFRGGETYVGEFSKVLWPGNDASLNMYCLGLLFEGIVSSILVVFIVMNYLNAEFLSD